MKIPRKIKEMPWPTPFTSETKQHYRITLSWPVIDHERLLVATFMQNTNQTRRRDLRLICSKKLPAAVILFKGDSKGKRTGLMDASAVNNFSAYPEISEQDEKALAKWLGATQTRNHFLPELGDWVNMAIRAEILRERDARGEIRDEDVNLCPEELPPEIERFIRNSILPNDQVLIYKKGNTRGFCFRCGSHVHAKRERFKQSSMVRCPNCGELVTCYLETRDLFKVDYVANLASVQKGTDGKTIFIRQWHLNRDHTGLWADVTGYMEEICRYAIRGDKVAKWQKENKYNYFMNTERYSMSQWTRMQNPSVIYDGSYYFHTPADWQEVFSGTALQYCDLRTYTEPPVRFTGDRNVIRFLMDWAQYPMVEKLWKAGYTKLVHERINGLRQDQRYVISWKKASFRESFRFPTRLLKIYEPQDWTMAKVKKVSDLWEQVKAGRLKEVDLPELTRSVADWEHIWNAVGHASTHRILRYIDQNIQDEKIRRQAAEAEARRKNHAFYRPRTSDVPGIYRDYLRECTMLHLDLDDRQVLFPPNLIAAHERTTAQVKYQANEIKREEFERTRQKLKWMEWEKDGLLIRLPKDAAELVAEGAYLHHCVAGYADRMADGKTVILLIRRKEEPQTPFFTLEWMQGNVQQCRTTGNKSYEKNEQVLAFVNEWLHKVAKKKIRKSANSAA